MTIVGLDIGGAHLKLADSGGRSASCAFPLWKNPDGLAAAVAELLASYPLDAQVAVTMTGELADCFADKRQGVARIVQAAREAAGPRPIRFYQIPGTWADSDLAVADYRRTAASNWHALGTFLARRFPCSSGLVVDVGSTTCDILPVDQEGVQAQGQTDIERLAWGELLYTGIERSPVCAVLHHVRLGGRTYPLAQELFATMADVYVVLGELDECAGDCHTADGRPRTRACSHARLARLLCADTEELDWESAVAVARQAREAQVARLAAAITQVQLQWQRPWTQVVLSGHGIAVARDALRRAGCDLDPICLADILPAGLSRVAPAYALVWLAGTAPRAAGDRAYVPRAAGPFGACGGGAEDSR